MLAAPGEDIIKVGDRRSRSFGEAKMITFRVLTDVREDREVVLRLPPEVPTGRNELVVSVTPRSTEPTKLPRSSLADWADEHAEHWGNRLRAVDVEGFTGRGF